MLAALDTPLKGKINSAFDFSKSIQVANESNVAKFTPDGRIERTISLLHALNVQEYMADIFVEELPELVNISPDLSNIARELKQYCVDFRDVLDGILPIDILADRSDFAAKFAQILENRREDNKPLLTIESARDDMMYDYISISGIPGLKPRVRWGAGYKLRQSGAFKDTPRNADVERAFYWPPSKTRASMRAKIIREYGPSRIGWRHAEVYSPSGLAATINLGKVNQTSLSEKDKITLSAFKK
jgi:hypothetical protein